MSVLVFHLCTATMQMTGQTLYIFSTYVVISINSFLFSFCIFVLFSLTRMGLVKKLDEKQRIKLV